MNENSQDEWSGVDLAAKRGERLVFSNLRFDLSSGDSLLLTGQNGSGKSTLLRLMAGLGQPSSGSLFWNLQNIELDPTNHFERLNYVGHLTGVKLALNVQEDLSFWMTLHDDYDHEVVSSALEHFGLYKQRNLPIRFLSSGQRRKLALARLLVRPSKIWLLDEPTIGLDQLGICSLEKIIQDHRATNGIVIVASHTKIELGDGHKKLDLSDFKPVKPQVIMDKYDHGK
ncbi:MAG: heme ABC transporter ATP-binding protein CcmA [Rhodospirillaceae bacterium]|nr:heme ABC transporter ATP-binding protein CcmA [Rhodospirillaceae bacterium]